MQKCHIQLKPDQKLFFTSDLHVGHKNVLVFCKRPFQDVKDMSESLIANWNRVVGEDDIIFDLGDMFWWDSRHDVKRFIEKLNGTIYKVPGNHDVDCKKLFELCDPEKVHVCDDNVLLWVTGLIEDRPGLATELCLSHFPLLTWPHRGNGVVNLFGHIHSGPVSEASIDIPGKDLHFWPHQQYDVGVDNNDYTPVEIRDIYKKLDRTFIWKPQETL